MVPMVTNSTTRWLSGAHQKQPLQASLEASAADLVSSSRAEVAQGLFPKNVSLVCPRIQ